MNLFCVATVGNPAKKAVPAFGSLAKCSQKFAQMAPAVTSAVGFSRFRVLSRSASPAREQGKWRDPGSGY